MSPPTNSAPEFDSAYLEGERETPQHPTVAETGALGTSPRGPGPSSGQLQRRESDANRRIVRLSSFGGEGLVAKPVEGNGGNGVGVGVGNGVGNGNGSGSAIADDE